MHLIGRAVRAYYRANVTAWEALRRRLPVIDPWAVATAGATLSLAQLIIDH